MKLFVADLKEDEVVKSVESSVVQQHAIDTFCCKPTMSTSNKLKLMNAKRFNHISNSCKVHFLA